MSTPKDNACHLHFQVGRIEMERKKSEEKGAKEISMEKGPQQGEKGMEKLEGKKEEKDKEIKREKVVSINKDDI